MIRFNKLTKLEDRRHLDKGLRDQLDWFVAMDILADRFNKIFKDKELFPAKFSKEVLSGSYWFVPRHRIVRYPDGTHTDTPLDRLSMFLNYELMQRPEKSNFYLLEERLGYLRGQICTIFHEHLGLENFLWALGFLSDDGKQTNKYTMSPRIQKYLALKRKEVKETEKRAREMQKAEKQKKIEEKAKRKEKLSKVAAGTVVVDGDGFEYKEEI